MSSRRPRRRPQRAAILTETGISSLSSQCHAAAAAADTSTPFATPSSQDNKKAMKQEAQGEQTHQNTADWQPIHYSVE